MPTHAPDGPVLVLGAGPAGLGAAYRLARAGHDVVVIEREDHVGGASASFEVAGQRVDHGSHRLHPSTPEPILSDLRRLLGPDLQRRERHGRIRLADRWIGFPLRPTEIVRSLPPGFAASALVDAATAWSRHPQEDTFAEVVRAQLGATMLDRFYGPYAEKLWGLPPEDLDGEQARRRISANSAVAMARRVLAGADPEKRTFLYPRRGFGQLWEALAEAAVEAGADLRLSTPATAVTWSEDGVAVESPAEDIAGTRLLSTLPLPVLAHLARPPEPFTLLHHARSLTSRAMVLVYLVVPEPRFTAFDAHYLPEIWTPVTRISEPKNYRDSADDPPELTVLCAEIPCQVGDDTWEADDDVLAATVEEALGRSGLRVPPVERVVTRRLPSAYPVYARGFAEHLDVLDRWASALPRVLTFGRQGLFVHDNSHHALVMAYAAADAIGPDGSFDHDAWDRARQGFRSHVVED